MTIVAADIPQADTAVAKMLAAPPFGVNEMRLGPREWLATIVIVLVVALSLPRIWQKFEHFHTGSDYRIPYALSKDYWLYQRRLSQDLTPGKIPILGDSVVWGEYVRSDGTLSHFLNQHDAHSNRFVNCGVNGMFPLALEGLIQDYGREIDRRKVIIHFNVLWLTSPKADLSEDKEDDFNHSRLVPQFSPRIPSYHADINDRLSAVIERHVDAFAWTGHLQNAYYGQHSIPEWTLQDDGSDPPKYPNAWRNPLSPLRGGIPSEGANDPLRGPTSPRHRSWSDGHTEPTEFDWVELDQSLQWKAFERTIALLRQRHNDVLIVLGPFNEHIIAASQRATFERICHAIAGRLRQNGLPVIVPETLPSDLYADASHPLTQGYSLLAEKIYAAKVFRDWLSERFP